ncbi:latrotoxin-related protein [Wolbachia pipientis]|uniref:latrotoxin-related protein n=1 Tax=Wolbachia pipientis TaxID=955 RepID=UPI0020B74F2B|nr:latrotoxin-related protein [Wolbachia pipientis]
MYTRSAFKNEIYLNQTRKISKRSTRQFVTSSASGPTSFINIIASTFTNAMMSVIQGVSQFISAEKHSTSQQRVQISDTNSTLLLLDVFIRKITGEKYVSLAEQSISSLEARGYALNITEGFKKVVERATLKSGVSIHRLNIDFVKIYKEITGKIISGNFDEIPGILSSCVEKVCPGRGAECTGKLSPKKFDKFVAEFNKGMINQSTEKILHNGDSRSEVDGAKQMNLEPQSYFSNASVHSHSEVSTCLSEIGITKLGGNLNR